MTSTSTHEPPAKKARSVIRVLDFGEDSSLEELGIDPSPLKKVRKSPSVTHSSGSVSPPSSPFVVKTLSQRRSEYQVVPIVTVGKSPSIDTEETVAVARSSDRKVTLDDLDEEYQELDDRMRELSEQMRDVSNALMNTDRLPTELEEVNSTVLDVQSDMKHLKYRLEDIAVDMTDVHSRCSDIETRLDTLETRQRNSSFSLETKMKLDSVVSMVETLSKLTSKVLKENNRLRRFQDRIKKAFQVSDDEDDEGSGDDEESNDSNNVHMEDVDEEATTQ